MPTVNYKGRERKVLPTEFLEGETGMSQIKSVLLWENQRRYIREALDAGTLRGAIVPTGSTEQHNEHLAHRQRPLYVQTGGTKPLSPGHCHDSVGVGRLGTLDGS